MARDNFERPCSWRTDATACESVWGKAARGTHARLVTHRKNGPLAGSCALMMRLASAAYIASSYTLLVAYRVSSAMCEVL